jgi:hypothetical protein
MQTIGFGQQQVIIDCLQYLSSNLLEQAYWMSLSRNLLTGLASSVYTALICLLRVPLYLKYLDIKA